MVDSGTPQPPERPRDSFDLELERSLKETQEQVSKFTSQAQRGDSASWATCRTVIAGFKPVPWFIWRLSNFVFSGMGPKAISSGLVLGLRRLLLSAANDPFFRDGSKITSVEKAIKALAPDVIAAVSVIHAMARRLVVGRNERIWRPILDDAILRAQIGYFAGEQTPQFGAGRGMLAGFAGRAGLAVLLSTGDEAQARQALELLATGTDISEVGRIVYGCDPLQVSAMALSASGCGKDAAFGTASYAVSKGALSVENESQLLWLSAFSIIEMIRMGRDSEIEERFWQALHFKNVEDRKALGEVSRNMMRRGHTLAWIL